MADLGLTAAQLANAERIASVGRQRGMSERDIQIAITVALAESDLQNYANSSVPESMRIPHDAVGSDHASVGVFQQQVGIWGNATDLMNLDTSAGLFFDALKKVPNRDAMTIPQAAQTVQRSAFSDGSNYAAKLPLATRIANSLKGIDSGMPDDFMKRGDGPDPLAWVQDAGNLQRVGLFILGGTIILIAVVKLFKGNSTIKLATAIATKGLVK